MTHRALISLTSIAVFALLTQSAKAASVGIKPGLWEWSTTSMTSETRTVIPEIDKVPKAERAQVETEMRKPVVAPERTVKNRKCVTSTMVRNWPVLTGVDQDYAACTRKSLSQGAKAYKLALQCGQGKTTGTIEYSADGDRLLGKSVLVSHESTYDKIETTTIRATRLGGDCSDLAPGGNAAIKN
jgi:uncharacterized protein DUF3617